MSPHTPNKGSRRYRYYVEDVAAGKTPKRLAANQIEAATVAALRLYLLDHQQLVSDLGDVPADQIAGALRRAERSAEVLNERLTPSRHSIVRDLVAKIRYRDTQLELALPRDSLRRMLDIREPDSAEWPSNLDPTTDVIRVRAPMAIRRRGPQLKMVVAGQDTATPDLKLITALVKARGWAQRLTNGEVNSIAQIAAEHQVSAAYVSATLPLAYLAPQLVEEILSGKRSRDTLTSSPGRASIDPSWRNQARTLT